MHSLILGLTNQGKTSLAKRLAGGAINNGRAVIVLDPFYRISPWPCTYQTDKPDLFKSAVFSNINCHVFIDESGEMLDKKTSDARLATQSRHYGHMVYFISQRAQMVDRSIRSMCSNLFVFRQSTFDAKILTQETAADFLPASQLQQGEFLMYRSANNKCTKMKLF